MDREVIRTPTETQGVSVGEYGGSGAAHGEARIRAATESSTLPPSFYPRMVPSYRKGKWDDPEVKMPTLNVVQCANVHHKILCLEEAVEAVRRARIGNEERNGRKVSIRAVITDPCTCHIDALIWLASDIVANVLPTPQNFGAATMRGFERVSYNAMH